MPSLYHGLRRKLTALFHSREGIDPRPSTNNQNTNPYGGVYQEAIPSFAIPSTASDTCPPTVVVTPTPSTADLGSEEDRIQAQLKDTPTGSLKNTLKGEQVCRATFASTAKSTLSSYKTAASRLEGAQAEVTGVPQSWLNDLRTTPSPRNRTPDSPISFQPPSPPRQGRVSASPATFVGSSYFPNAHGFNMRNTHFITNISPSKTVFEHLGSHIVHGAAHNSDERCCAPKCHPETRMAIREDIFGWIKHDDEGEGPKMIMWLSGPAGAGKTAIAGSVAETSRGEDLLAGCFFFSSYSPSADRRSKRGFVATLAYHMSQNDNLHLFKSLLLIALQRHPDILHKNLLEQAECLILAPFRSISDPRNQVGWPKVIIIDGLDEVVAAQHHDSDSTNQWVPQTSEDDQVEILDVLLTLSKCHSFPFRIFVASRPERNIADFFAADAQSTTVNLFLDSKYNPDTDIECFLKSKFSIIQHRAGISKSWPGKEVVDRIVDMSSGQFIVPTTIIRWVEAGVPQLQLAEVLELEELKVRTKNPFATLDALYSHILRRARNSDADPHLAVKWILCIASAFDSNQDHHPPSVTFWRQLLEDVEGELSYRLAPITSLISIPLPDDCSSPITIYHKSLVDFLASPTRSGDLHVEKIVYEAFLTDKIVAVFRDRGPASPLSPSEANAFLAAFLQLSLLVPSGGPSAAISTCSARFLASLGERSKAELASCDVAWWTTVCLSVLVGKDGTPRRHSWLLRAIYCRIHKAMGCDTAQHEIEQAPTAACHAACIHWRTGILAKAKELNWCAHKLEEVGLEELVNLGIRESITMLKENRSAEDNVRVSSLMRAIGTVLPCDSESDAFSLTCSICQPAS